MVLETHIQAEQQHFCHLTKESFYSAVSALGRYVASSYQAPDIHKAPNFPSLNDVISQQVVAIDF